MAYISCASANIAVGIYKSSKAWCFYLILHIAADGIPDITAILSFSNGSDSDQRAGGLPDLWRYFFWSEHFYNFAEELFRVDIT